MGAAAGVATGGIVGALAGAGVDKEHAAVYSESIRRGVTLVTVRVPDDQAGRIEGLMSVHRPIDPVARGAAYRQEGRTTFDPDTPACRPDESEIERMRRDRHDEGMGKQV